jgi:hypothetical protein
MQAMTLIARAVRFVASVIAVILLLGIAFAIFDASATNTVVSHVNDWAHSLAGPFDGMFHLHSAKASIALNWGLAAVVYLLIGAIIARIVLFPAGTMARRSTV